jgi:hypothetical protein
VIFRGGPDKDLETHEREHSHQLRRTADEALRRGRQELEALRRMQEIYREREKGKPEVGGR